MMLTLVAVSLNDQPLSQQITAVFSASGGTIGRADHNTMTLPDPQRHISRLQAEVMQHGNEYVIRNVGAANPITVGTRTLNNGETARLSSMESIRIGGYLLQVQLDATTTQAPRTSPNRAITRVPTSPPVPQPLPVPAAPSDPFADLFGAAPASPPMPPGSSALSQDNPFADLLPGAAAPASSPMLPTGIFAAVPTPGQRSSLAPAAADPFADLMPAPAGVDGRAAAIAPPPAAAPPAAGAAFLPDDFDPFAAPPPAPAAPEAQRRKGAFDDLISDSPAAGSVDQLFGLASAAPSSSGAADDPLARFLEGAAPSPSQGSAGLAGLPPSASLDPLAMFGAAPPPPMAMAQPDHLPAVRSAFVPPKVAQPSPLSPTPPPMPAPRPAPPVPHKPAAPSPAPSWSSGAAASDPVLLWKAFCEGAGIDAAPGDTITPEKMRLLGEMLHNAVEGILQLVAVRASTKHELRAGVTVIQQRNNNPLKFSPDAKAALEQLVQPPLRGFLDGPHSMDDAMHDLVGHSIGTVAGMRAAVEGVLRRFEPQALEEKLVGASVFDSLIPINRKAKLWDLYLQHQESIREEAQEDFHTLFGKAFLAAYEQQVARLKRKKSSS
jgi:FHA domain-containing protein